MRRTPITLIVVAFVTLAAGGATLAGARAVVWGGRLLPRSDGEAV